VSCCRGPRPPSGASTFAVSPEDLEETVSRVVERLAGRSRHALATVKSMIQAVREGSHEEAVRAERELFMAHAVGSEDFAEGLAAFAQRRAPVFPSLTASQDREKGQPEP
jgi:enoyl-CoA hydratase